MATLLQPDKVLYLVRGDKRIRSPLSQLYFCRYCSELRSLECVSHEVDSHFCPSCLENMPSAEAKLKKNRCANCFDCPCCMHTLSTRATNIPAPLPDDPTKTAMKKAYYLACGFCRWTSRDVGMADKSVASGGWQEPENPHTQRINKLIEYYQQLAQREKLERDRKKLARRRPFMPQAFSEKYGLGTRLQRQRSGAPISALYGLSLKEGEDPKEINIEPAQALDEVEPLPEDYYTRPINLPEVTTLRQRLLQPDFQPAGASQLHPRHKHLLMKRSLRCRKCEHNLSKPEFNPTSIKFKIQLVAVSYIPEVRIMSIPNLRHKKASIALCNMTKNVINGTIETLSSLEDILPKMLNNRLKTIRDIRETCLQRKSRARTYGKYVQEQVFESDRINVAFDSKPKKDFFIKHRAKKDKGKMTMVEKSTFDLDNLHPTCRSTERNAICVDSTFHVRAARQPSAN
ncbi:Dynactin subunit 4 [Triplophysa tibetana]|uniref:Dynactin subunit 4 n=1 Tax=Triplophysa tibetana TaxID=1572043 RepID=A0A5A9NHY5_9TELE|nr:Dynactin subunit 4 [Triplophysa tibetana]